jgi:hypothetical protein
MDEKGQAKAVILLRHRPDCALAIVNQWSTVEKVQLGATATCKTSDKVRQHPRCLIMTRPDMRLGNNTAQSLLEILWYIARKALTMCAIC